jgi:predicted nucleic acid-binding protein
VRGYLLDTNILNFWFNRACPEHSSVMARVNALDVGAPLRLSAISWGEIEYGHRCVSRDSTPLQMEFSQFVETKLPQALPIGKGTSAYYGEIRSRLFDKFAPKKRKNGLRPCQLIDPLTAKELGIQENDLWIAAQAAEFNLVIVTHDRMARIREVVSDLIDFDDWAA